MWNVFWICCHGSVPMTGGTMQGISRVHSPHAPTAHYTSCSSLATGAVQCLKGNKYGHVPREQTIKVTINKDTKTDVGVNVISLMGRKKGRSEATQTSTLKFTNLVASWLLAKLVSFLWRTELLIRPLILTSATHRWRSHQTSEGNTTQSIRRCR